MSSPPSRYADWKAPDEDGQILIWPEPSVLARETGENQKRLTSSEALVQNVPLGALRRAQRNWLGHVDDDRPLVATGHQSELCHSGVWAKDALIDAVARRVAGRAWHFAVDTDSPKHLHLRWPGGSMAITEDPRLNSAAWGGLLDGPTPGYVAELETAFADARLGWDFEPMVEGFLAKTKRLAIEQPKLPFALAAATGDLDASLGLRRETVLMSAVWGSEPYLTFAHHLLARAGTFASQYNAALAGYRAEQGISSPGRPMPDLSVTDDEIEAPFWLDDLADESRGRLFVKRVEGGWGLMKAGETIFAFKHGTPGDEAASDLLAALRKHRLRLSPRALTLTMFFRLLLADQFVHGIGGGRYDQVTDRLIESHFGIEPPRFAVTTATLYFPAARGQKRISLRPLLQEGRRLKHGSFSREKRETADRIATLPRRSRERGELFSQMHSKLAQQAESPSMREWSARLDDATREQMRQKTLFDRELFYAIQPEERLRATIDRYDAMMRAPV